MTIRWPFAFLLVGSAILGACSTPDKLGWFRPECPTHDGFVIRTGELPGDTVRITTLAISGPITTVPEYHDCQRFIVTDGAAKSGGRFGPMVAIFARDKLGAMWADVIQRNLAGVADKAVALAEIYAYDGAYKHLGIERGFNCLYMYTTTSGAEQLPRAFMLPVGDQAECSIPQTTEGRLELQVTRTMYPHLADTDYPDVARWDHDQEHRLTYIGLKCGTAWCEVAGMESVPPTDWSLVPSPALTILAGDPPAIRQVRGWYDRQPLAIPNTSWTPGDPESERLVPSGVFGVVTPALDLNTVDSSAYDNQFSLVAIVELEGPLPLYQEKLGITFPGRNQLFYCHGDAAGCGVVGTPICGAGLPDAKDPWYARIVSSTSPGTPIYKCLNRNRHDGVALPGTTRWRWLIADEGIWGRCPFGCCPVT